MLLLCSTNNDGGFNLQLSEPETTVAPPSLLRLMSGVGVSSMLPYTLVTWGGAEEGYWTVEVELLRAGTFGS